MLQSISNNPNCCFYDMQPYLNTPQEPDSPSLKARIIFQQSLKQARQELNKSIIDELSFNLPVTNNPFVYKAGKWNSF